ncbi:MAG: hypothetical protein JW715_04850 [Sedimentisphaerales bacterium]|nr:hypothetical protein [Sedimentisphaerales bacterium]
MKKLSLILITVSICAGCTTGYRVHVNGFSESGQQLTEKASVYVSEDPNSQNPIFDKQIKAKIEELLKYYDYVPALSVEQANYRLIFQVTMDSHSSSGFMPLYHPYYMGYYGGYRRSYYYGYTTYVPYYDKFYDQRLVIKVFARNTKTDSVREEVVWVGEAMISTSGEDIRQVVDYLLVACFEYFGADTTKQKSLVVTENDPRILKIESLR